MVEPTAIAIYAIGSRVGIVHSLHQSTYEVLGTQHWRLIEYIYIYSQTTFNADPHIHCRLLEQGIHNWRERRESAIDKYMYRRYIELIAYSGGQRREPCENDGPGLGGRLWNGRRQKTSDGER